MKQIKQGESSDQSRASGQRHTSIYHVDTARQLTRKLYQNVAIISNLSPYRFVMAALIFSFILFNEHVVYSQNAQDVLLMPKREHSLIKPYQGSGMTLPHWEFFGSTVVTNNYVRLTQDAQSRQGGLWNKEYYKSKYWQVEVAFKVSGHGTDLFGDGLALWYVRDPPKAGSIFGNIDYFIGLGVFLDTYANQNGVHSHGHPYISAMVNNGTLHYDHDMDGTHSELAGCECKFRGLDHDARVLLRYFNDVITVKTDIDGRGEWQDCFEVTGVYLPTHYYFGVTAATGDLSDNHDILSIKMMELSPALHDKQVKFDDLPRADHAAPQRDRVDDMHSGMPALRKLFIIVCVIAAALAVCGAGYFVYTSRQKNSRKRFY